MRVLWFTDSQPQAMRRRLGLPDRPGPQAWVDALAARLSMEPGLELAIATWGERPLQPFADGGIVYYVLPMPSASSRVGRIVADWQHDLPSVARLDAAVALVREIVPSIVHVHGTEGAFGLLAPMVTPTPCVISLQGILQAWERLYFAGRSAADMVRFATSVEFLKGRGVLHDYLLLRRRARREACIMRGARWFIGRTDWDRAVLAAVNPAAAYYHCDEIMRAPFYAAAWTSTGKAGARLYSTSSDLMGKGTECLLQAVAILGCRGVGSVRLRVAGVRPGSELDRAYRRAARLWGVEQCVDWLGRLDAAHIVGELLAADLFVYPSHVDNSPNAVVEAMTVGVPIVAARVGGVPSLVRNEEEGLLVPRGDAAGLAGAVDALLSDCAKAARLGAAARLTALRRNDPASITARTVGIYQEIITAAAVCRART